MRGIFDEEEEVGNRSAAVRDTELTLGSATLLGILFGLVLLCGLCFGMGYAVGHRSSLPSSITPPQPAPDQEPLQGSGSIPKPSAIAQTPVMPPAVSDSADQPAAAAEGPPAAGESLPQPGQVPSAPNLAAAEGATQSAVHPALASGSAPPANSNSATPSVRSALPSQPEMVQIAAVSNPEDADVLVNALRKRNYPVTARRDPDDNYIHVRIGPFATRAIADQWRLKLLSDGYNAIIQP